jgi:hypothetical protein
MYWQALDLPMRLPWFIATFERPDGKSTRLQTLCLWWTVDLLSLQNQVPAATLRALQCVCPHLDIELQWQIRDVAKVWQGTEHSSQARELLFEDTDGGFFSAFHPEHADTFFTDCAVVIELPRLKPNAKKPRPGGITSGMRPRQHGTEKDSDCSARGNK